MTTYTAMELRRTARILWGRGELSSEDYRALLRSLRGTSRGTMSPGGGFHEFRILPGSARVVDEIERVACHRD